jgi:hypothetical protein
MCQVGILEEVYTFNKTVKNQHDPYSEERSQQADIRQHNIITIVEQQTTHMWYAARTRLKWNL